jgi:PKD repeat protein
VCPSSALETSTLIDRFYWNGSDAVFYGEDYIYQGQFSAAGDGGPPVNSAWWDAPTDRWYNPGPFALSVTSEGAGQVSSTPGGIDCGYSCDAAFDAGTVVTLTATPDAGSLFAGWSGDCSGTGICQVTMDQVRSVYAMFDSYTVDLTVWTGGSGSGSVASNPAGIVSCGTSCEGFDPGTVVTLTATPDAGSVFAGWSGECSGTGSCQLTMSQARWVTASFVPPSFALTVAKQGTGSGQVSSSPGGITCGAGCQASFDPGTVVTVTATPDPGSLFAGWSGDCSGSGSCQLTMSQARSVTATFAPNQAPHASFTLTCTSLACNFDAGASSDPDNGIAGYAWNFGDESIPLSGPTVSHTYPKPGSYTVTLTVTDHAAATDVTSKTFNPISVSARGYRQNGAQKVNLSWTGASGTSFDVYRNDSKVASLQAFSYADTVTGKGSFSYKVCAHANSVCSNTASVSF